MTLRFTAFHVFTLWIPKQRIMQTYSCDDYSFRPILPRHMHTFYVFSYYVDCVPLHTCNSIFWIHSWKHNFDSYSVKRTWLCIECIHIKEQNRIWSIKSRGYKHFVSDRKRERESTCIYIHNSSLEMAMKFFEMFYT